MERLTSTVTTVIWLVFLQGCGGSTTERAAPLEINIGAAGAGLPNAVAGELAPQGPGIPDVAGTLSEPANAVPDAAAIAAFNSVDENDADSAAVVSDDTDTESELSNAAEREETVVEDETIPPFPLAVPGDDDEMAESALADAVDITVVGVEEDSHEVSDESIPLSNDLQSNDKKESASHLAVDGAASEPGHQLRDSPGTESITDLIFLTGQSNAASLVTKYDVELDSPDQRVLAFTDQGWKIADLHQFWDKGIPGNFSADNSEREPYNNIIFQVGKALAKSADRRVGIVMLTAPGEGISHWDYGGLFYSELRDHAIAALNEVPHKSSFDAMVWMQGETDWLLHGTADPDVPPFESYQSDAYLSFYPRKLSQLIEALRSDPWFGGDAKFICAETIKAALNPHLMALNTDNDALTGCAVASDLPARDNDPHGNHFSAESLRVLGQRIADLYLAMQP